jgi:SsrA-binding protein
MDKSIKVFADNKRARFDYDIKESFNAGLVLTGAEVKSVKGGNTSLAGSYVTVSPGRVSLINCHIGPYKYAPNEKYLPTQTRQLLLNKSEINKLLGKEKGLIIIPLEIFQGARGLVKIRIGLGKARKKADKREYIQNREIKKEIKKLGY